MVLATGGDIVSDEYNDKFDGEQKPKFEDVVRTLRECFG